MAKQSHTDVAGSIYNQAVCRAIDAAALKASDARDNCGHEAIDHASQAALENSGLVVDSNQNSRFARAYSEVFVTTDYAVKADRDTSDILEQVHRELLRVNYDEEFVDANTGGVDKQRIAAARIRDCIDERFVDHLIGIEDLHVYEVEEGDSILINLKASADDGMIPCLDSEKARVITHIMQSYPPVRLTQVMGGRNTIAFKSNLDIVE
jgi:hypothetical protein